MIPELSMLKDFIDLGATFIIAILVLFVAFKKLDEINSRLIKILALLTVIVSANTNFQGIEHVLNNDSEKVADSLPKDETPTT